MHLLFQWLFHRTVSSFYSEDLQHRLTVENQLVIQNPFVL